MTATHTDGATDILEHVAHDDELPCEEADSGCTNAAAWRGVHIACGWGPLWCTPCIAIWKQQVDALDYTAGNGFQCKACKEQINGPDEMEARPL